MGLVLELVDEILPVRPKGNSIISKFDVEKGIRTDRWTLRFSIPNAVFQFIDCIVVPMLALYLIKEVMDDFSLIQGILALLAVASSLFSISQFLYFFIKPVDTYLTFTDRLLGETAVGCLLSALFDLSFKVRIGK